jgi:hypothetical protein
LRFVVWRLVDRFGGAAACLLMVMTLPSAYYPGLARHPNLTIPQVTFEDLCKETLSRFCGILAVKAAFYKLLQSRTNLRRCAYRHRDAIEIVSGLRHSFGILSA